MNVCRAFVFPQLFRQLEAHSSETNVHVDRGFLETKKIGVNTLKKVTGEKKENT